MKKTREVNEDISVWTTNFPNLLKLTKKERQLNPNVMKYKRPQTLATLLTNYKIIAHKVNVEKGVSHPCGKCMLRNRGREGEMIKKQDL